MDPALTAEMEDETNSALEAVRKQMAWRLEKNKISHDKLRARFLDPLAHRRYVVRAICTEDQVATFRGAKESAEFKKHVTGNIMFPIAQTRAWAHHAQQAVSHRDSQISEQLEQQELIEKERRVTLAASAASQTKKSAEQIKLEERKRRRKQRELDWKELNSRKPDKDSVNLEDQQAIEYAEKNQGDYKLKTSDDYFVPEDQRVNVRKKRNQLLALRQRIFEAKSIFNEQVETLRTRKSKLLKEVSCLSCSNGKAASLTMYSAGQQAVSA